MCIRNYFALSCISIFQWVLSIDLYANEEANENVLLENSEIWSNQEQTVRGKVESLLADSKVDAIFCVAGGWAGGNSAAKGWIYRNFQVYCYFFGNVEF